MQKKQGLQSVSSNVASIVSSARRREDRLEQTTTTDQYQCELCKDTGWKPVETDQGKAYAECDCVRRKRVDARMRSLVQQSGLIGSLKGKSFENYAPRTQKQRDAFNVAVSEVSFFLIGPYGTGKTHLLAASVNAAIAKMQPTVFFSAPWLMKIIREDLLKGGSGEVLEKCCEVPYLAVDDLGKEKSSDMVQQALFMIFDRREINGLRTSVTSNYMPDTLRQEKLDGAIVDRILGMCKPVVLDGTSYRWRKAEGNGE
jgi:DNA replication protein DnaC